MTLSTQAIQKYLIVIRNKYASSLQRHPETTNAALELNATTASNVIAFPLQLFNASVEKVSVSNAKTMTTLLAPVKRGRNGLMLFLNNKPTQSGLPKTLNYALGVIKPWRDRPVAISWHAYVGKVSAICAVNLGNRTTKTISNAIFIGKKTMMNKIGKKLFYRKLIFMPKDI